jgi:hypothetical protein
MFNSYGKSPEGIYLVGGFKFIAFRWDADSQPIKFEEFFVAFPHEAWTFRGQMAHCIFGWHTAYGFV